MIENEEVFGRNFGVDVIAGMLGQDPGKFGSRGRQNNFDADRRRVMNFVKRYQKYDWTQELDESK